MNEKKISIIVPVYNVKEQLERCLDSISGQTYRNFECFLVDDGSTDGCGEICDFYAKKDDRFVVIHQKNAGLSVARNNAMNLVTGDYVSFIDSDDYVMPEYLENMVNLLQNNDCDIAKCDYFKGVFEKDCSMPQIDIFTGREFTERLLTDQIGSQLWQYLFKKDLWQGVVSPVGRYAQDMMILHIVTDRAKRIVVSTQKLYFYYIDRSNSTSNAPEKKVKGAFDRAIAFKVRYEFALKQNYIRCLNSLMVHVLDFYNNAETLKQKMRNKNSYSNDQNELSKFLKRNKNGRKIKKIGIKHAILGFCLTYWTDLYSKIGGRR